MYSLPTESHSLEKRQSTQLLDLIPIGEFKRTDHDVRGMVYAFNNSLLLIEDFGYDGQGFGVYLQGNHFFFKIIFQNVFKINSYNFCIRKIEKKLTLTFQNSGFKNK
jgi:hypothetical protein